MRKQPCAVCGQGTAVERSRRVEVQPLGRRVRFARREWKCGRCGEAYLDDVQANANTSAEIEAKAAVLRDVDGADLRLVRELAEATQVELEAILGLGRNTVARWETGQRPLPRYIAALVRVVALHPSSLRELAAIARVPVQAPAPAQPVRAPGRPLRVAVHAKPEAA